MRANRSKVLTIDVTAAFLAAGTVAVGVAFAQKTDKSEPKQQRTLALGEDEVKQLVLLMDTDKNGKVSQPEFMSFMAAEFDRLEQRQKPRIGREGTRAVTVPSRQTRGGKISQA